jgi:hypothetical protein
MRRTSSTLRGRRTAFIPALRHEALTPAYDFLIRLTMLEFRFKVIHVAAIDTGQGVASSLTEKIARKHVADNLAGMLMPMLEGAGFMMVEETGRLRSIVGVLRTIRSFKLRTSLSQERDS